MSLRKRSGKNLRPSNRLSLRNAPRNTPARIKPRNPGRTYLLLSTSLLISGRVRDGVGVESFLDQVVNRSGASVVFSPRFGAEAEVWENRLKTRGGVYVEPTRFATSRPRAHATLGMDLRLTRWSVFGLWPDDFMWQIGGSVDVSRRYLTWGLSIGGWYPRHHRSETH